MYSNLLAQDLSSSKLKNFSLIFSAVSALDVIAKICTMSVTVHISELLLIDFFLIK